MLEVVFPFYTFTLYFFVCFLPHFIELLILQKIYDFHFQMFTTKKERLLTGKQVCISVMFCSKYELWSINVFMKHFGAKAF